MKNMTRHILLSLLLPIVSTAYGGSLPTLNVSVSNAGGKVVYSGKTNASGAFASGKLEPGNYVVQFTSNDPAAKSGKWGLAVVAGSNNFTADAVSGAKISDAGVAMKVVVSRAANIKGQIASGAAPAMASAAPAAAKGKTPSGPVKIMNGKRYYWVRPMTSSLSGGEWVEEEEAIARENNVKAPRGLAPRPAGGTSRY